MTDKHTERRTLDSDDSGSGYVVCWTTPCEATADPEGCPLWDCSGCLSDGRRAVAVVAEVRQLQDQMSERPSWSEVSND